MMESAEDFVVVSNDEDDILDVETKPMDNEGVYIFKERVDGS